MGWYTVFMLIALPVIGIGWIGYAIWLHKIRKEEKVQGKPVSARLRALILTADNEDLFGYAGQIRQSIHSLEISKGRNNLFQ